MVLEAGQHGSGAAPSAKRRNAAKRLRRQRLASRSRQHRSPAITTVTHATAT